MRHVAQDGLVPLPLRWVALFALGGSTMAQEILHSWDLGSFNPEYPSSVKVDSVPDLDGDGFRELVVGDSAWPPSNTNGRVFLQSGLKETRLWETRGTPGESLGRVVATVGDMNGDGFPEVAAANGGHVSGTYVLNGRDGSRLSPRRATSTGTGRGTCSSPTGPWTST